MSVSLAKGGSVSLTKVAADAGSTLRTVTVGLGWKANQKTASAKGGFFRRAVAAVSQQEYDLDASAFVLGSNGRFLSRDWFIYYGHTDSPSRLVSHSGDDLTGGEGVNDDEQIVIKLDSLPREAQDVVVVVNIYQADQRGQSFGDVEKAFMRITDDRGRELARYDLVDQFSDETAVTFGKLSRDGNEWKFTAIGNGERASLTQLAKRYGY